MQIKIQNVVTTSDVCQQVDVTSFKNYPWGEYDQEIYRGICGYIKDHNIRGKVTIFITGKMISLGAKTVENSIAQLRYASNLLHETCLIKTNRIEEPKVRNIVATIHLRKSIDFSYLFKVLDKYEYDPESFPAVIFRHKYGTCLIFKSGNIIINGVKSEKNLRIVGNVIKSKID